MASVTRQTNAQSGKDTAASTRTSRTKATGRTIQAAAKDTTVTTGQQVQPEDYAFTIAFSLTLRDAVPCAEV